MKIIKKTTRIASIAAILYILVKNLLPEYSKFIISEGISPVLALMALWRLVMAYRKSADYSNYILCMIIATLMYVLGDATWIHHKLIVSIYVPANHISSAFYITSSIFVFFAVILLGARLCTGWDKFRTTVDVFVIGTFISYIAWNGFFLAMAPTISMKNIDVENLIIMGDVFLDFMVLMGILVIYYSDGKYFRTKYGSVQMAGIFIWSAGDLVKWYMAIFKSYNTGNIVEMLWPLSLLIVATGIYAMAKNVSKKDVFKEAFDADNMKSASILIFLLFAATLIFKPMFEVIVFFVLLIFFRIVLYRYMGVYEENYKLSLKYKEVNETLSKKINEINNFNLNLEKNFQERTRELEIKNQELHNTANIDPLTKIPNRRNFINNLDNIIEHGRESNHFAILFIDLDRFKGINDWYGHDTGDLVLIETAKRISENLEEGDFLARLGGDEFVVILGKIKNIEDSLKRSNDIVKEFNNPFVAEGKNILSTISVGIAIYPVNSKERIELMKFADVALYRAKTEGRNRAIIYDRNMKKEESRKLEIESRLNESFSKGELYLNYQPQIRIDSVKIVGFEALVRWENGELGEIGPGEFVGIAEENGLIIEIGELVIEKAFKAIKHLNEKCGTNITMAVNVSPKQFNATNLVSNINDVIKKYDVNPAWIEIEITENLSIRNEEAVLAKLEELKEIGIAIVIDDFGMGYSSFSYLKKYPIDKLKIDRAFIIGVSDNHEDYKTVKSIISMCKELGIVTIAEGVEKRAQVNVLKQLGCDIIQGYYYSKPVGLEDLENVYFELEGEQDSSHPHWEEVYDIFELT